MRVFNKIVTLLVLLLLLGAVPALLFAPDATFEALEVGLSGLRDLLSEALSLQPVLYYAVGAIIELVLVAFFLLEFRRQPSKEQGRVKLVDGGTVEVAFRPIALRLEKVATGIRGVKNATAEVSVARRRLKVAYDVTLRPGTTGRTVQAEIERATRDTVEHQLGIKLAGKPSVNFQLKQATRDASEPRMEIPETPEPPRRPFVSVEPDPEPEPEEKSSGGGLFGFGKKRGAKSDAPEAEEDDDSGVGGFTPPPPVLPPGGFSIPSSDSTDD